MKAKTINFIRETLIEEQKKTESAYKLFKKAMIDKYKTDWVDNEMNELENNLLESLRVKWIDATDACVDFENYQW